MYYTPLHAKSLEMEFETISYFPITDLTLAYFADFSASIAAS